MRGRCGGGGRTMGLAALALLLLAATRWEGAKARPVARGRLDAGSSQGAPSVVLVMCDSFDGRLTFYPGNQTVTLPSINLIKQCGTVFLNAYTNSPICCPSRAAMWSGLFTHLTESWNNFKGLDPNYTTWMDLMQKHGYHTQKYGKIDYTSGHHSVSNRVEAWTRDVDFLLRQEGRPMVNLTGNKTFVRVMEKDWQNTDKAASWIRNEAINISQPFVLYLGLNLPHPYPSPSTGENFGSSTFLTSPYWLEKVRYEAIKIPKWPPLSDMHPVDYYSSYTKNCTGKFTIKEIRDIRAFYYAMCAETDAMLADHGELAMEHQQFYKMSMYEASSHVPLLVMGPGIKVHHHLSNVVSLVDIYPTMLDIARIPVLQNLSGYSLLPLLVETAEDEHSFRRPHAPWVLSEFHGCNVNSSTYMLRTDKWKYIAYSDGHSVPPQLFDLSADPDELTNIATTFPEVTHSLDKKLRSIVNYPRVSAFVHKYNKKQFINWKQSLGQNYSSVIANLRWHQDWFKEPRKYEDAIHRWLQRNINV
ncbi:arylsulfatase K isoform X2 [Carettochelys insculpta]|uniref:arylsulfatase K isoform X2 n=1 Tax=Carettochelys insculpta TaxID=44489 RepID=UPI003EBDE53B